MADMVAPAVAALLLMAVLTLRALLLLRLHGRERRATALEIERRRGLGLTPTEVRLEATEALVALGSSDVDDDLRWESIHLTACELRLRTPSGRRFLVPAGTPLLALGVSFAARRAGEFLVRRDTPLWVLAPPAENSPESNAGHDAGPYRQGAEPLRLDTDVELSEQRAHLELALGPRYRPRWVVWAGLVALVSVPSLPGLPPAVAAITGVFLIGATAGAVMTGLVSAFRVDLDDLTSIDGWVFFRVAGPWPARHQVSPGDRGGSP